jgi:hypothetical protein
MSTTQVSSDKIRAYTATSYRLGHSDTDIILKIGTLSPQVLELFKHRQVTCGAFLTAFNPRGSQQLDAENEQAHARLVTEIVNLGLSFIEGSGSEEGTEWPTERSMFALGLGHAEAEQIGRLFDQDAIVWVGIEGVPQLILLR